ncbi:type IX secretion system protein PorQ [Spirosoma rhododendri]|uniref:Type IX secretion system protein PorQ n=1 Tax=Spirosoma rhododendri TaxID=2728024 RepID=A0A7L5DQI1_9BACT|nr:type IX secretion system protein PorQ [Spirosoma rhododendri]QJD80405.1 type IX secretion system protein PorQ [Spirosoma rhododendri]
MGRFLLYALLLLTTKIGFAQTLGGQRVFSFLDLPTHARVAALGGQVATATQPSAPYFQNNPALADSLPTNQLSISLMPYLAAAKYYTLQYGLPVKPRTDRRTSWSVGMQYLSYGQFDLTDPAGNKLGTFTANDYALGLTHARTEGNFTLGATIKAVGSSIETYSAFGLLADFGGVWRHPKRELTFGLTAKNVGYLFKNYGPANADLPFDLQAGVTVKPLHAPIRLTLTAHHLQRFDIAYNDTNLNVRYDLSGNPIPTSISTVEKVARHLSIGAELLLSRNVQLLVGYNHQKRQEGRLTTGSGLAGISFGAMVQARGFQLTYARFSAAPTAGTSQLSLSIDINRFLR